MSRLCCRPGCWAGLDGHGDTRGHAKKLLQICMDARAHAYQCEHRSSRSGAHRSVSGASSMCPAASAKGQKLSMRQAACAKQRGCGVDVGDSGNRAALLYAVFPCRAAGPCVQRHTCMPGKGRSEHARRRECLQGRRRQAYAGILMAMQARLRVCCKRGAPRRRPVRACEQALPQSFRGL